MCHAVLSSERLLRMEGPFACMNEMKMQLLLTVEDGGCLYLHLENHNFVMRGCAFDQTQCGGYGGSISNFYQNMASHVQVLNTTTVIH